MFTPPPSPRESHHQDIVTLISLKDKDIFEELFEQFFMIQEEAALSSKSISEILINTKNKLNISWLLKVHIADNTFSAEEKPQSQLETYYQSIKFQKVQPSATLSHQWETREPTQDAQAPMPPLLATLRTEPKPESDFHLDQERPSQASAEPLLVSLLEVDVTKNPS